jgi:hypothetical protein
MFITHLLEKMNWIPSYIWAPSFPSLERLNQFMNSCYTQDGIVPQLPRPLEGKNVNSTFVRGNG